MSVFQSVRRQLAPIHPEGYVFLAGFVVATLVLFWLWAPLGWLAAIATAWCAYFFRDPARVTPVRLDLVVAPADGRVSFEGHSVPPADLGLGASPLPRVSIFMSVFDCHVNRAPVEGRVTRATAEESDAYFQSRPRGHQLSGAVSPQSHPIADLDELRARYHDLEARLAGAPVPRPEWWGGYWLVADAVELWRSGADRMHDRVRYQRDGATWTGTRLAP